MTMSNTEMSYRRMAVEGASPIGLMIALFDTLVGNLRRAASALRENDIETRCKELNHAALVLARLESWLDLKNGGESAQTMARFYAYLRAKMMEASMSKSAEVLEAQIDMVVHVRSAWQQLDLQSTQVPEKPLEFPMAQIGAQYASTQDEGSERISLSLSA
jgi:flagellar protein FliS